MTSELTVLPCPFCGCDAAVWVPACSAVTCQTCGASGAPCSGKITGWASWNTRAALPTPEATTGETPPEGAFGYCPTCYHPLDQCSHCDSTTTVEELRAELGDAERQWTSWRIEAERLKKSLRSVEEINYGNCDELRVEHEMSQGLHVTIRNLRAELSSIIAEADRDRAALHDENARSTARVAFLDDAVSRMDFPALPAPENKP